ncbi:uncharacterized protein B0H18DRAFT_1212642 [Fomitopsis serialis]|uniref:uncharacterized protein n=1 Tax=Fomitopsis serialis TaxID=139415 RepID=UPI0020085D06|nr:uncharacterized protein B0H18DRAFT_1212642 [Neoantrodia serialis]KAH9922410.1 hypothetical protein B0H18DRAFT_1212642 [Neoantrodia serialis]
MQKSAGDVKVTDKMIKEQAILEATRLGYRGRSIPYFHCGRTWVRNFKARFGIVDGIVTGSGYTERDELRAKALGNTDIYFGALPNDGYMGDIQEDEVRIFFDSAGPSNDQFARWEREFPIFRDALAAGNTRVTFATSSSRDDTQTGPQSMILAHADPEVDSNPPPLEYAGAKPSIQRSDDVYMGEYRSS